MKRKSGRKSKSFTEVENGIPQEDSETTDEPQVSKGRISRGRRSKLSKSEKGNTSESEQEFLQSDREENGTATSQQNGNKQKKERRSKGRKSKSQDRESTNTNGARETNDPEDDDDTEYEVQEILNEKFIKGVKHYLIRWKGYTEESDTWEPENTLDCQDLIKDYQQKKKRKQDFGNKKKSKKHMRKSGESKGTWDENENFEVDRILDVYFHRNGRREFLVSWKGYPASDNSWEPEDNMDCKELIHKFMSKVELAKQFEGKESKLRTSRKPVNRLEFKMHETGRRLSKRRTGKER
ncbi:hypothetical protein ABEB36_001265 [Hypothenemus hampei]